MVEEKSRPGWKERMYIIIFESDTPGGKLFDVLLLWAILLSVLIVTLESVIDLKLTYVSGFVIAEWVFTILFTIEYIARIIAAKKHWKYIFSFYGIIDFLSIIPTYLSLFFVGAQYFLVVRSIRLLRVFRILKLTKYLDGANTIQDALSNSRHKIIVFLGSVLTVTIIMGTFMYIIEGPENGFDSIPKGIYWAIVTLTTVGYGDMVPLTAIGKAMASMLMIMGYGIIAVPTGIVTSEMINKRFQHSEKSKGCNVCLSATRLDEEDNFCRNCGRYLK